MEDKWSKRRHAHENKTGTQIILLNGQIEKEKEKKRCFLEGNHTGHVQSHTERTN